MKRDDTLLLMQLLKGRARALGVTQAQVAKRFAVSLPTVKRWFAGKGIAVETLTKLMQMFDVTWHDIASEFEVLAGPVHEYTLEQEKLFVRYPSALAYFNRLRDGLRPIEIEKQHRLSKRTTRRYLQFLETVGLIEIHPNDKIRVCVEGESRWIKNGPLSIQYKRTIISEFSAEVEKKSGSIRMGLHHLFPEDAADIQNQLSEIRARALRADRRARLAKLKGTQSMGLLFAFEAFEWDAAQIRDDF